jgi:hypothetical protein
MDSGAGHSGGTGSGWSRHSDRSATSRSSISSAWRSAWAILFRKLSSGAISRIGRSKKTISAVRDERADARHQAATTAIAAIGRPHYPWAANDRRGIDDKANLLG